LQGVIITTIEKSLVGLGAQLAGLIRPALPANSILHLAQHLVKPGCDAFRI